MPKHSCICGHMKREFGKYQGVRFAINIQNFIFGVNRYRSSVVYLLPSLLGTLFEWHVITVRF